MKKPFLILALTTLSLSAFSQFQVGRSKEQIKTDETNAKPKRIGAKLTLLTPDYELYSLVLKIYETINFSSAKEEKDFFEYVLGLFDEFKDNEVTLSGVRIVPHPMKLLGINNIMFDVYKKGSTYKNETVMISKKAWIRLFEKSRIHSL
eukprot:gene11679-13638_t